MVCLYHSSRLLGVTRHSLPVGALCQVILNGPFSGPGKRSRQISASTCLCGACWCVNNIPFNFFLLKSTTFPTHTENRDRQYLQRSFYCSYDLSTQFLGRGRVSESGENALGPVTFCFLLLLFSLLESLTGRQLSRCCFWAMSLETGASSSTEEINVPCHFHKLCTRRKQPKPGSHNQERQYI